MKLKFPLLIFVIALLLGTALLFLHRTAQARAARQEVIRAYNKISLGAPLAEVRAVFTRETFQYLELHEEQPDKWLVQTPLEWGAANWLLIIELKDERVHAVRIRTQNSAEEHPPRAPADKVTTLSGLKS